MTAKRLLLVDVSSIYYPAWHASADKPVGFAYEVTIGRVREAARNFEHVAVCCDAGRSFRKELDPRYKAGRPDAEPAMLDQLRRAQDTLAADGFMVARADTYEADDVIATFVAWAHRMAQPEPGVDDALIAFDVEILSSDKDLLALVGDGVRARSVATRALFGPEEVMAKFGVRPSQMADYLALVGDASDNVRGVAGIGPKHASRLLTQFGTLDDLLIAASRTDEHDHCAVGPPSIRDALALAARDGSLGRARELVALRTDVPIDCAKVLEPRVAKPLAQGFGTDLTDEGDEMADTTPPPEAAAPTERQAPPVADAPPAPAAEVVRESPQAPTEALTVQGAVPPLDPDSPWALEPRTMKGAVWLASSLFNSRLFVAYGNPEAVLAVILAGREMGLGAMTALRGMNVIKGKVAMSSQLMIGLVLASGKAKYFDLVESTPTSAKYVTRRKGSTRDVSMTFAIAQAKDMGLLAPSESGKPTQWQKDPENMLRHRCAARLARVVYPDVCSNTYLPEELEGDE